MSDKIMLNDELMFPSDYLCAVDFKGKQVTLTIASVSKAELWTRGGGNKTRPVFTFIETKKKFVCNPTNGESIAEIYGRQAADWVGKRVTFFPTKVPLGRKKVDAIRVIEKVPPSKGSAPLPASVTDDPPPHEEPRYDDPATLAAEHRLDEMLPPLNDNGHDTDRLNAEISADMPQENREPEEQGVLPLTGGRKRT